MSGFVSVIKQAMMLGKPITAILSFATVLGIGFPAMGTPSGTFVRSVKPLDQPNLFLVEFTVVSPQGVPGDGIVTHNFVNYTYRVYCPTAMVRDVTEGKWGTDRVAWDDQSIGPGALTEVIYQVCPQHFDRITNTRQGQ